MAGELDGALALDQVDSANILELKEGFIIATTALRSANLEMERATASSWKNVAVRDLAAGEEQEAEFEIGDCLCGACEEEMGVQGASRRTKVPLFSHSFTPKGAISFGQLPLPSLRRTLLLNPTMPCGQDAVCRRQYSVREFPPCARTGVPELASRATADRYHGRREIPLRRASGKVLRRREQNMGRMLKNVSGCGPRWGARRGGGGGDAGRNWSGKTLDCADRVLARRVTCPLTACQSSRGWTCEGAIRSRLDDFDS
ncbi:hypothetical protein BDK51DRAFT_42925 [Blyttiomyces helicus]|uniref:Uncharacterized protein n=1 Tax=Blyttiomyces helicus TaxID=388810 RepID=A0A4V1IPX7_9FUNG|nr:hypothetical protein BDK51DRAFT_42925 [Blyttiomyces helicus]|eukprot:RKO84597.1 hypothetical protein BDK51DRAFT_42925 [Blyttiomyces helicus]